MHRLRLLIASLLFQKCFVEGPSNWFLFMFQTQERVHDQLRTPDSGLSQVTAAAWHSCPGEEPRPGLGGREGGSC